MKDRFQQFLMGRYGTDSLNMALIIAAVVLIVINWITGWSILYSLALVLMILTIFRSFSRNISKRQSELATYEKYASKVKGKFSGIGTRVKQSKTHRFFKCPFCSQEIRVPKGKGNISITCPKCHKAFIKKT